MEPSRETAGQQTAPGPVGAMWKMLTPAAARTKDSLPGSQTTPGPMRPVPPPCLWLLVPLPHLLPSLPLWVPLMVRASLPMVTPPLDPSHLALDPADMDLDLDLVMAVLAVCMDPTWEHCSHMEKLSQNPPLTRMLLSFNQKVDC